MAGAEYKPDYELTKGTGYLILMTELWYFVRII